MDLRQHLEVETPEHVVLDYEIAGVGSRALAALLDSLLLLVVLLATGWLSAWLVGRLGSGVWVVALPIMFVLLWGYFAFFEGLREGQTPGKRALGIRVIRDSGHGITMREAALRNLLRLADFLPPPYLLGTLMIAIHPKGKRLGDVIAGTIVVRDRPMEAGSPIEEIEETADVAGAPWLSDEEYRVLREFGARAPSLDADVRARIQGTLMARFSDRVGPLRHLEDDALLAVLLREETLRRRRGGGSRPRVAPGSGKQVSAAAPSAVAERFVARKDARWREFERLAEYTARSGLDGLASGELPEFAARYREVAADLARARTYRADPAVLARLERVVASGHNLLYRSERGTGRDLWRFLSHSAPRSVFDARIYVLASFLAFSVPAFAGYSALRARPQLAEEVLPDVLLERASEGVERKKKGLGYGESRPGDRPMVASAIIVNNVQVALVCFALGVFFAAGSIWALANNGLLIGAASGHYHNVGVLDYLWTFVAGHGVLELFAIWCAGAGGLLIGTAIVRPGAYSRREALVVQGRLAIRLVGLCAILLLVAGLIEGLFSTSRAPAIAKISVSAASAIALLLYLIAGYRQGPITEGDHAVGS